MKYNIVTAGIGHLLVEANVLPTPRLISEGTRHGVEAYRSGDYEGRGMWRCRDDSYDPPGTEYRTVMVETVEEEWTWD